MFVLIWATLLFSVSSNAYKGRTVGKQNCKDYCVTFSKQNLQAEAGLCVVIPCYFRTAAGFTPKHIVWFKCEASIERCVDADIIFHSNKNTGIKHQSGFKGRVSLLEPDVREKNCSIIINDLRESDSGSYQLRVTGKVNGKQDGFTFIPKVTVSVKGLTQKPTVTIPTLTEGQQATLTCTAPGLCSGSVPDITWTWRGAGGTESHITGNSTAFKNLTLVTQRHISVLTFNPSAEHHNTSVTCKITFTGETTTEETLTVTVNYNRKPQIIGNTTVKEGDALNLTCCVESFPPSLIVWKKLSSNTNLHNGTHTDLHSDTGSATLVIHNVTAEDSGEYICTAKYLDTTVTLYVNVTVTWFSKILDGSGCVLQSEGLTCVCISEGSPLPIVTWPLLKHHSEYSVITSVSNHTVNSTVSLPVKKHGNTIVECVSNNGNGEESEILLIRQNFPKKEEQSLGFRLQFLEIIIAFLIGVVLSSIVCCSTKKCYRKSAGEATRRQESTKTEYAEIRKAVKEERQDGEEAETLAVEMINCEPEKEEGKYEAAYSIANDR
ncbi:sialic acid-binding Ig-like lectin 14 [Archocentrus centrarchus]|uniref:sialic acid-binding Ig-like lectin 14 n=1 Tax=Archocentrus centrarchus TaxID=63155 RepID=UPI0011EA2CD1|nr:sialic acid-binding Ig-like lectin 14 [Archocentrus centrarchus]